MIEKVEDLQKLVVAGVRDFSEHGKVRVFECDGMIGFDYTAEAEFEAKWTPFERMSRGLVLDIETGAVLARPYDKFFNVGQHNEYPITPIKYALEKADGSLGIVYYDNHEQVRCNTRGSFLSDQAVWATEYIKRNEIYFPIGCTTLCEIIYPENRIVVDYKGEETLIIHGVRDNHTGEYWDFYDIEDFFYTDREIMKTVRIAKLHPLNNLQSCKEFVEAQRGVDCEGLVLVCEDGSRYKMKGEDYLRLHRLVTDVTPKRVWELLCAGEYSQYRKEIPDEFLEEFDEYADQIFEWHNQKMYEFEMVYDSRPETETQKEFALWVQQQPQWMQPCLFKAHKGMTVGDFILSKWKDWTNYVGR